VGEDCLLQSSKLTRNDGDEFLSHWVAHSKNFSLMRIAVASMTKTKQISQVFAPKSFVRFVVDLDTRSVSADFAPAATSLPDQRPEFFPVWSLQVVRVTQLSEFACYFCF
jgi:hypothetical protein